MKPEFSAKVFGITSKDSANFLIAYCSKPGYDYILWKLLNCLESNIYLFKFQITSEIDDNCFANSISTAPAPGSSRPSLKK